MTQSLLSRLTYDTKFGLLSKTKMNLITKLHTVLIFWLRISHQNDLEPFNPIFGSFLVDLTFLTSNTLATFHCTNGILNFLPCTIKSHIKAQLISCHCASLIPSSCRIRSISRIFSGLIIQGQPQVSSQSGSLHKRFEGESSCRNS